MQNVLTSRVRVLVTSLAWAAGILSSPQVNAQTAVGSVLENGQVVVKIYVTMNQVGLPSGRPIGDFTFLVVAPSGERSTVTTSDAGTTELHLRPGAYRVVSIKPLEWYSHHYMWDLPLEVREGMHVLDLTPRNSAQTDVGDERVALGPSKSPSGASASAPSIPSDRNDAPATAPPAYLYKSPGTAAILSFLVPGVGQMYNGQVGKGVGLFLLSAGAATVGLAAAASSTVDGRNDGPAAAGVGVFLLTWIYSIVDAHSTAKRLNAQRGFRVGAIPVSPYLGVQRGGVTAVGLSLALR